MTSIALLCSHQNRSPHNRCSFGGRIQADFYFLSGDHCCRWQGNVCFLLAMPYLVFARNHPFAFATLNEKVGRLLRRVDAPGHSVAFHSTGGVHCVSKQLEASLVPTACISTRREVRGPNAIRYIPCARHCQPSTNIPKHSSGNSPRMQAKSHS